jgi:ATP synthase protein I
MPPGPRLSPKDARAISIGIEFVVSVLLGLGAGFWLDRRFHTSPWLTLVGIAFGFAAGIRSLLRLVASQNGDDATDARSDDANSADAPSKKPPDSPSDPGG